MGFSKITFPKALNLFFILSYSNLSAFIKIPFSLVALEFLFVTTFSSFL